jgi:PPOX class probable F420-dependent enzyme
MTLVTPASFHDLLKDETRAFAFLATTMPDGTPQVTPVWFNTDEEFILVNSAEGRVKDKNMRLNPRVALAISDPKNPYRYIQIRGRVVEITKEGARQHIDQLSKKYTGRDTYTTASPAEQRVIYKIRPEKYSVMG